MSEEEDDKFDYDDTDDSLSEEETQKLNETTTKQERAILIKCAIKNDPKCRSKILKILRDMKSRDVDLKLINKYAHENLFENRVEEVIFELVDEISKEKDGAKGLKKKGRTAKKRIGSKKRGRKCKTRRR